MSISRKHLLSLIIAICALLLLYACSSSDSQTETPKPATALPEQEITPTEAPENTPTPAQSPDDSGNIIVPTEISGEITITFDYERISGSASNQYAIWIEDMNGNYINTVFATQWTAQGGFTTRPDSIALWAEKAGIASMPDYYVDAISGATPRSGTQSYTWDMKDIDGNTVAPGEYVVYVEGTLRWKNYVLYSATVDISGEAFTVEATPEYVYEGSDRYDALSADSLENAMIGTVKVSYTPADN